MKDSLELASRLSFLQVSSSQPLKLNLFCYCEGVNQNHMESCFLNTVTILHNNYLRIVFIYTTCLFFLLHFVSQHVQMFASEACYWINCCLVSRVVPNKGFETKSLLLPFNCCCLFLQVPLFYTKQIMLVASGTGVS